MNEIEKSLNLGTLSTVNPEIIKLELEISDDSALKDFEQARSNIVNIIRIGTDAVSELGNLASQSQGVDYYEALSGLMKNLSDTSEKLLKTHEAYEKLINKKAAKREREGEKKSNMIMSTKDLATLIEGSLSVKS